MDDSAGFPCTQCGECCRHIDVVPQLSAYDAGNGTCIHLKGNLCGIYASRPEICSVDKMYKRYYFSRISREEFYELNIAVCRALQKKAK